MADARFEAYLREPRGHIPDGARTGAAGGAACGDLVRVSIALRDGGIVEAGADAEGCGATLAAASAVAALVDGRPLLEAARIDAADVAAELGGLIAPKLHAADLAADALHRALGQAARFDAELAPAAGRTLVAMSGGVDSAVAALLCAEADDEPPVAVTLELWASPENDAEASCCSATAVRAARALAHSLGLAHLSIDLREEFRAGVVEPWLADHAAGLTPNPCVRCNGEVRLDAMLALADRLGAATLATGHYARLTPDGLLRAAADPAKDQSYMLAALRPGSLARMRFPLGELTKAQVRERAAEADLPVARKPDSQDLCFLAGTGKRAFLARHGGLAERPGAIVDGHGRRLGTHAGHTGFTVGQRKGLSIGGGEPLYVLATDARANTVTVGPREALATRAVALRDLRLHRSAAAVDRVRLRYRSRPLAARLSGEVVELLDEPVVGAAPGQAACLMAGDVVVGSATIA